MAKFYTVFKGLCLLKHFQQAFIKIVFKHQFHNEIEIFAIFRDPNFAAMTS